MKVNPALIMFVAVLGATLIGCESKEKPAEQAGQQMDQGVEKPGEKIEETGGAMREEKNK
jgi:hypothetical protein